MEAHRRLTFDCYTLDLTNEQLLCEGEVVPLTPKAFAVLRRLVEDAGQLVTKEELLRAGWADTHVTEGVLKANVLELRRALADDAAAPRFIESVPRRGYRFIAPPARSAAGRSARSPSGELVGRDQVLARLEACLERAGAGERQLLFVSGEPGIGKTSVLDALLERGAAQADVLIAPGACLEHYGAAESYLPVLEAIGRLLRPAGAERLVRLFRRYAPTWLAQLPWLADVSDRDASSQLVLGASKERMLREMAEALEALTATTTLILVLEDLHWSDHSTIDLLGALGRRDEVARLLIVGSYRPTDVIVSGHPLGALVQELRVRRQCEEIALDFLGEAHVGAYLAHRFGDAAGPQLAAAVHLQTDGNPLFMVRLADELVALGMVAEENDRWVVRGNLEAITSSVPDSLRGLIDRQIGRLDAETQRVLEAAGVLGNHFTAEAVAAGLGEDALSVEERCEVLARQRQLVAPAVLTALPGGGSIAQYSFTHNLYPQVLAARVSAPRRIRLHHRIGSWLEERVGPQTAPVSTQLAWHFEEAHEYGPAIRYLIIAAENAANRFAYRDAIRILEHALALVPQLAAQDLGNELEIQLWQRIGDARYCLGAMFDCATAYETAAARAAEVGLTTARIEALSGLVRPFGLIDPDRGIAAIEQAVRLSAECGDALLHACTEMLAAGTRLLYDRWRAEDWQLCASASDTIQRLSNAGPFAYHQMIYAHLQVVRGDYAAALAQLETGIPKSNEPTSMMAHFFALSGKTLVLLHSGRLGELITLLRDGREMAERNGTAPWMFIFREAWLRTAVLDFEGARRLCETVIQASTEYPTGQPETIARFATGYAELERNNYPAVLNAFGQVLDSDITPKFFLHWYWRLSARLGLTNAWLASANIPNARAEATRFLEAALSTDEPNLHALAWEVDARVAMAEKNSKGAEVSIEKALAVVNGFDIPTAAWRVHRTRSDLYRRVKNTAAAEQHRARAEAIVLALADSFAPDEPLRNTFLAAGPIRSLRSGRAAPRARK